MVDRDGRRESMVGRGGSSAAETATYGARGRKGARGPTAARAVLHGTLLLVLGALTACSTLDDVMVAAFGRSMRDQSSFDPYENTIPAPEGSVPFAAANWPAGPGQLNTGQPEPADYMPPPMTQGDLLQQNPVVVDLANPVEASPESLARGEELYARYCAVCHGDDGIGSEAYIADRHPTVSAYDVAGPTVQGYTDGYIYGMIRVGRGLMPPYGHAVSHFDRWDIVNYVRELQRRANPAPEPAADDADAGDGGAPDAGAGE